MPSERGLQLQNLMSKLPVANQKVVQGLQEGQRTRMGAQLIQPGMPTPAPANMNQIAAVGAQGVAEQGKTALAGQQATIQQRGQVQQQQIQEGQRAGTEQLANLEQGASQENRRQSQMLANIESDLKTKLIDQQMQFDRDQAGNVLFNVRQLTDWAAANARSEQDFKNRMMVMDQASDRKIAVMRRANELLKQTLEKGYLKDKQIMDHKLQQDLVQRKQALELEIRKAEAKAASKRMMSQGIGTIVGMGVGGVLGGGIGAMAGGSLGGGVGSMVGAM